MIKVLFVCHGNICRSTMAEFIFKHRVKQRGLEQSFDIDSAGTSSEEIGNDTHYGTKNILRQEGIPFSPRRAKQIDNSDYDYYDYIIYMDANNLRNLERKFKGDPLNKFHKITGFDGNNKDVADPWYSGNFRECYDDINKGLKGLFEYLLSK